MRFWRVLVFEQVASLRSARQAHAKNLTEPTEITENGSVTKAVFAANPLGEILAYPSCRYWCLASESSVVFSWKFVGAILSFGLLRQSVRLRCNT